MKKPKESTLTEKAAETLSSLTARIDASEDDVDINVPKEVTMELTETLTPSVMAGRPLLQRRGLKPQEKAGVLSSAKGP